VRETRAGLASIHVQRGRRWDRVLDIDQADDAETEARIPVRLIGRIV